MKSSSEVSDDKSLLSSESEAEVDSEAVEGAYSCFNGDDDLLFLAAFFFEGDLSCGSVAGSETCACGLLLRSLWEGGAGADSTGCTIAVVGGGTAVSVDGRWTRYVFSV